MAQSQQYPISQIPAFLSKQGFEPVTYKRVRDAAVACRIPATQRANGRWFVDVSDPDALAESLSTVRVIPAKDAA
jgi:hypothetical protein